MLFYYSCIEILGFKNSGKENLENEIESILNKDKSKDKEEANPRANNIHNGFWVQWMK